MNGASLRGFFLVLICALGVRGEFAHAAESGASPSPQRSSVKQPVSAKPAGGVGATVRTDGALIYDQPDFDANTIGSATRGQRVRVSKGTTGAIAKFHKVRAGALLGYIVESDVQVDGAAKKRDHKRAPPKSKSAKKSNAAKDRRADSKKAPKEKEPMVFTRFVGLLVGQAGFKEGITGVDATDNILIYGLKVTGPDVLLDGPIMDFNLALHFGAPAYYDALSSTKPSGFVLFTDALFLLPFNQAMNHMVYFGAGPLLVLSNFKVTSGGSPQELTALNAGLSLALGAGFRFDNVAVRLEGKYFIEKQSYRTLQLSVQTGF